MEGSAAVKDFIAVYTQAVNLFTQGEYDRSWQMLDNFARRSEARSLVAEYLKAHILWAQEKYVSEVALLEAVLRDYASSDDKKRLAGAYSLLGAGYARLGRSKEAVEACVHSTGLETEVPKKLMNISDALFTANAIEDLSPDKMQELYSLYRHYLKELAVEVYPPPGWHHKKIRIGYLSADLMNHAVGQFVRPFFFDYDSLAFEVFVYQLNRECDFITEDLRRV